MNKTDPYLSQAKNKIRLVEEFEKYGRLVVAYDFDNTVHDYHNKGYSFDKVVNLLRRAKEMGCYLIVFTCSDESRYDFIKNHLKENDIPFDAINENCPDTNFAKSGKIYYNILLDDRAGLKQAYMDLQHALDFIKYINKQ